MKRFILFSLAICGILFSVNSQKIKGSETVLPISEKTAQIFMKQKKSATITVTGGGSGVGISALLEGTTDIAQASRKIKFSERQKLQNTGQNVEEVIIAYDALAIIVNPGNNVNKLTREQLEGIFTGKIKNWNELGGANIKIIPYSRETSSGTYEFFREYVLENKNFMSGIMSMPANGSIIQSVSQTKGAIAYVGLAYLNKSVKPIAVSFDNGKSYSKPTVENAKNKSYPVVRPLYFYYNTASEAIVKPYIDFVLSPDGQKIIEEVGYVTVK
jgi:phosphate transport system substrate-binding protein